MMTRETWGRKSAFRIRTAVDFLMGGISLWAGDLYSRKQPLENFARWRARKVRENLKVFRHFISRKFFAAERPKFLVFHGHSFMKEQESFGNHPASFILHSDNRHLFHLRVCRQQFFDFPRINIFARRDNQ